MVKKERWTLNVIPWSIRIIGLFFLRHLLVTNNVWFIPCTLIVAYHAGAWMHLKLNEYKAWSKKYDEENAEKCLKQQ